MASHIPLKLIHITMEENWGGGEQQLVNLYEGLLKAGIQQHILCQAGSAIHRHCEKNNYSYSLLKKRSNFSLRNAFQIRKINAQFKADIIHVHDVPAHNYVTLANIFFGLQTPLILTRRVSYPIKKNVINKIKYSHHLLKKIICVSKAVQEEVDKIQPGQSIVIYEGIDLRKFNTTKGATKTWNREDSKRFVVANIARLSPEKDQFTFLDVAQYLLSHNIPARFLIIGDGVLATDLKQYARKLNIENHVEFLGFRQDIPAILQAVDALLITSTSEGLCSVCLEAMACKVPVVATYVGGIPEIINHTYNGLLANPKDVVTLANLIMRLYHEPQLYQSIVKHGYESVSKFGVHQTTEQVLEVLYAILPTFVANHA